MLETLHLKTKLTSSTKTAKKRDAFNLVLLLSDIKRRPPIYTVIDKGYTSAAVKGIHLHRNKLFTLGSENLGRWLGGAFRGLNENLKGYFKPAEINQSKKRIKQSYDASSQSK